MPSRALLFNHRKTIVSSPSSFSGGQCRTSKTSHVEMAAPVVAGQNMGAVSETGTTPVLGILFGAGVALEHLPCKASEISPGKTCCVKCYCVRTTSCRPESSTLPIEQTHYRETHLRRHHAAGTATGAGVKLAMASSTCQPGSRFCRKEGRADYLSMVIGSEANTVNSRRRVSRGVAPEVNKDMTVFRKCGRQLEIHRAYRPRSSGTWPPTKFSGFSIVRRKLPWQDKKPTRAWSRRAQQTIINVATTSLPIVHMIAGRCRVIFAVQSQ